MINFITNSYNIMTKNVYKANSSRLLNLSVNPLKPLEKDTVSFSGKNYKYTLIPEYDDKNDIVYAQKFALGKTNSYKVVYYCNVNDEIQRGLTSYPPDEIRFKKPISMKRGLDVLQEHLFGYEEWELKDKKQVKILKEFISKCDELKGEKLVSMIDAMNNTLVLELEHGRVLKMVKYNPFPEGRPFEPNFDLPVLSDVYSYKDYYIFIQEKADTQDIDEEALDSVIERIIEAGYEPFDIKWNESQIGWSPIKEEFMLLDTECARKKA